MNETTILLVKPDGVANGYVDVIRSIILAFKLNIEDDFQRQLSSDEVVMMYTGVGNITGRDYFPELVEYMSGSPSHVFVVSGDQSISTIREIIGKRNPPSGIRAWWSEDIIRNVAHGPHNVAEAQQHLKLFDRRKPHENCVCYRRHE